MESGHTEYCSDKVCGKPWSGEVLRHCLNGSHCWHWSSTVLCCFGAMKFGILIIVLVKWFKGLWIYWTQQVVWETKPGHDWVKYGQQTPSSPKSGREVHAAGLPKFLPWRSLFVCHWLWQYFFYQISQPSTCSHSSAEWMMLWHSFSKPVKLAGKGSDCSTSQYWKRNSGIDCSSNQNCKQKSY